MRHLFLSLSTVFLLSFLEGSPEAATIPTDKAAHFGIAATAQSTCSAAGRVVSNSTWGAQIVCFVAINAVGAVKEFTDPYHGHSRDERDIYANLAGSGISFFVFSMAF